MIKTLVKTNGPMQSQICHFCIAVACGMRMESFVIMIFPLNGLSINCLLLCCRRCWRPYTHAREWRHAPCLGSWGRAKRRRKGGAPGSGNQITDNHALAIYHECYRFSSFGADAGFGLLDEKPDIFEVPVIILRETYIQRWAPASFFKVRYPLVR